MDKIIITIKYGRYEKTIEGNSAWFEYEKDDLKLSDNSAIEFITDTIQKRIFDYKPGNRKIIQKLDARNGDVLEEASIQHWRRVYPSGYGNIHYICTEKAKGTTYKGFQWRFKTN